jgi:DNA mismatch repair protein MutL
MSDIIHLLPDNIANQIAAGEVIQRPSSVVKELVENAIDAGATHIQVNIKDAGRTLIQVIDNGKGMSETDARMAFERHATSKISTADDLFSLHTMGFRGEALASIVAVAQVDLQTRLKGSELGTHLAFTGSKLESCEPVGCAEGSIFSVKNLFFNVPARRKFLKSNDTEFRNILTEFERVALVCPKVAMSLYHNDVQIFDLPETGTRQRIIDVYGKKLNEKLLSVNAQSSLIGITGFVGRPDMVKKRGLLQYFFVNGRFMRHPYFHKAVLQAYEQLIPAGEQPDYFIYFTLDPSAIDVNIHPTKTEIKFENEQPIWQILMSAVRESLAVSSSVPTIDFDSDSSIKIPVYNVSQKNENDDRLQKVVAPVDSHYNPFHVDSYKRPEFDWSKLYNNFEKIALPMQLISNRMILNPKFHPSRRTSRFQTWALILLVHLHLPIINIVAVIL